MSNRRFFLAMSLVAFCCGCQHGSVNLIDEFKVKDYVRNRAALDYDCPASDVQVGELGNKTFSAVGCGKKGIYQCRYPAADWYEMPALECAAAKPATL